MECLVLLLVLLGVVAVVVCLCYRRQCLLRDRAFLMREAIRDKDFSFSLPADASPMLFGRSLFFGERAMQQVLNELGKDISQLVAQNEVESWQRLTRVLTHEIMNATAPIRSISQAYLSMPQTKGTEYEEGIRAIYDTSTALADFVDSYRKLTQMQKATIADVPLLPLVEAVRAMYPDIEWRIDIPDATVIKADDSLMRQVLINIIKNATEAGAKTIGISFHTGGLEAGNRISNDGASAENRRMITISNDGLPIPPDIRRDIFIPFFTTKPTGTGIGLSLSRQLLMLQNMTITLSDIPAPGYHVTCVIALPNDA